MDLDENWAQRFGQASDLIDLQKISDYPLGFSPPKKVRTTLSISTRAHCTSRNSSYRLWVRPLVPTGRLRYTAWAYKEGQTSKRRSAFRKFFGGVAEWTNALVLKTRGGKTPVGSNPTAPAFSAPQHVVG